MTQLVIDPALLNRLKGIELRSRFLVRGMYNNRHRTRDFGSSTEFVEHREYRRGDEIRNIDWRAYARTGRFYVKLHEMEANMRVTFMLDTSASMRVAASPGLPTKLELGATIVGALARMVQGQQDSGGLFCLGDKIELHMPERQGMHHLNEMYQHLTNPPGKGGGNFGELVGHAARRLKARGMVFVISDALDSPDALLDALKVMRVRDLDVTLIHLMDRKEMDFPFDQMTEFRHPESGARLIGDPAALRKKYLERLGAHLERVEAVCQKAHAGYLRLVNDDDLVKLLSVHFIRRMLGGGTH